MSYNHTILVTSAVGQAYSSYFDAELNEHIVTSLNFILTTTDLTTNNSIKLVKMIDLPPPNTESLIPFSEVTERTALDWIDQLVDVVELQNKNIEALTANT